MFLLYTIDTKIDCQPEKVSENYRESILSKADETFNCKIIKNQGVCICIYDLKIIETIITEGYFQAIVDIRLVIFKPFLGEVLTGKIKDCTADGIEIDLIFAKAFIPSAFLNESSSYDEIEGIFIWHYDENELFYDKGEIIRFKVNAFIIPDDEEQNLEILGRANEDGLGLIQWWM